MTERHIGRERIDLTDQRFGSLTVVEPADNVQCGDTSVTAWVCKCDCGAYKVVTTRHLLDGGTRSCGCMKHVKNTIHGMRHTRLYRIWCAMKYRCNNSNSAKYNRYGGRGIKICDEWNDFEPFMEWSLSHGYTDELSIDRIDNDGDYTPENCRWADAITQSKNNSRTLKIEKDGEVHTLTEWAKILDKNRCTLKSNLYRHGHF